MPILGVSSEAQNQTWDEVRTRPRNLHFKRLVNGSGGRKRKGGESLSWRWASTLPTTWMGAVITIPTRLGLVGPAPLGPGLKQPHIWVAAHRPWQQLVSFRWHCNPSRPAPRHSSCVTPQAPLLGTEAADAAGGQSPASRPRSWVLEIIL